MLKGGTPKEVLDVIDKLEGSDRDVVMAYIDRLESEVAQFKGDVDDDEELPEVKEEKKDAGVGEDDAETSDEPPFPASYVSGEDYEKASSFKQEAADLKSAGDWSKALDVYTLAVQAAPPSALLLANRATALLKLGRPKAAERDCDAALKENPDSAKALRVRGKARKELGKWEEALKDLSASQAIDFDEGTVEDLKFLTEKRVEAEKNQAEKRNKETERLRKRAEEIREAQEKSKQEEEEQAREEAEAQAREAPGMGGGMGGMPFMPGAGGGPGGGGGGPDMSGLMGSLMSDPELLAAMQKPKVQAAFQELMSGPGGPMGLMSNPAKLQELMADPEVGPVLQKLMAKLAPGMAGAGGMPGGFPGAAGGGADEDIPNISENTGDIDLDDLPDLEPMSK